MSGIPAKLVKEWQAKKEAAQAKAAEDAKPTNEKHSSKHKPKPKSVDSHYRDRAQERRFHEQVQAKSEVAATQASVLASLEAPTKGLDFDLLAKTRNSVKMANEVKREIAAPALSASTNLFKMDGQLTRNSINASFGFIGNGVMLLDGASKEGQVKGIGSHLMTIAVVGAVDGPQTLMYLNKTLCEFFLLRATKDGAIDRRWMEEAFLDYDQSLPIEQNAWTPKQHFIVGATASVILLNFKTRMVHLGHVGDARSLVFDSSSPTKVLAASRDHVPSDPLENERISKAGSRVVGGRIFSSTTMKSIEVSRMFGYRTHKAQVGASASKQVVVASCDYHAIDLRKSLQSDDDVDLEKAVAVFIGSRGVFLSTLSSLPIAGGQEINTQIADWCVQNCLHRKTVPVSASLVSLIDQLGATKKVVKGVGITTSKEELAAMEKDSRPAKSEWSAIFLALRATQTLEQVPVNGTRELDKEPAEAKERRSRSRSRSRSRGQKSSSTRHSDHKRTEKLKHKERDHSPDARRTNKESDSSDKRTRKHKNDDESSKTKRNPEGDRNKTSQREKRKSKVSDSEEDSDRQETSRTREKNRKQKRSRSRSKS